MSDYPIDWPAVWDKIESLDETAVKKLICCFERLRAGDAEAQRVFELFDQGLVDASFVVHALTG